MEPLLAIAAEYGIAVKRATLDPFVRGFYRARDSTIYLNRRLTGVETLCVLAHELGHVFYGHNCTTGTNENQANDYAARLLIRPHEYARAELVSHDAHHIAEELGVTVEMVLHYRKHALRRLGEATYARESPLERTAPRRVR